MSILAVVVLALGASQDDVTRAVERLGSDDVTERERAARDLERLGPPALGRLEKARDAAADPEVRGRLEHLVRSIRKREEFGRVFGETRRITLRAATLRAGDAAAELGMALGEKIVLEGKLEDAPVDLALDGATLWEALDRFAAALGAHYAYGHDGVTFRPGRTGRFPAHCSEQFRVAITEIQRLDFRAPGPSGETLLLTLELGYQRNMKPVTSSARERFTIESVSDAAGAPALSDQPRWGTSMSFQGLPHGLLHSFFARADAKGPLTVSGATAVPFAYETKELRLALEGEGRKVREGPFTLAVEACTPSAAGLAVSLRAEGEDDVALHRGEGDVHVLDAAGRRHRLIHRGGVGSAAGFTWDFEGFEGGEKVERPVALLVPWITKLHWVEIPFRFEGVEVPGP